MNTSYGNSNIIFLLLVVNRLQISGQISSQIVDAVVKKIRKKKHIHVKPHLTG